MLLVVGCIIAGNVDRTTASDIICSELSTDSTCIVLQPINDTDDKPIQFNSTFPHPETAKVLQLKVQSNVKEIPPVLFATYALKYLEFPNASVQSISSATFEHAKNLRKLDLHGNRIRVLPARVFSHTKLEWINLSWNEIDNIENYALDGLVNLNLINFIGNRIKVLHQNALTGASHLHTLHLESNGLETIEDGALRLPALNKLLLGRNHLKTLADNWLWQAPLIQVIDLSHNQLTNMEQAFSNSHNLSELILDNNPISELNLSSFVALENLSILALNDTGLELNADNIHKLNATSASSPLTLLNLSHNNLTTGDVFKHLVAFNHLNVIFLENNELTHLHDTYKIKDLFPQLNTISLMDNPICDWLQDNIDIFKRDEIAVLHNCSTF